MILVVNNHNINCIFAFLQSKDNCDMLRAARSSQLQFAVFLRRNAALPTFERFRCGGPLAPAEGQEVGTAIAARPVTEIVTVAQRVEDRHRAAVYPVGAAAARPFLTVWPRNVRPPLDVPLGAAQQSVATGAVFRVDVTGVGLS